MKPADLQPLASSGVAATLTAAEVADTLTASMGLPPTNLSQFSHQFPSLSQVTTDADSSAVCYRGINLDKAICTTTA